MIDANLRTPQLHTYLNLDNKAGLSDILAERATLAALTRIPQFVVDLSVLTAGTQPPNPTELLARSNLGDLIAQLSRHYDVILIDTPPAEQSADFQDSQRQRRWRPDLGAQKPHPPQRSGRHQRHARRGRS